MELWGDKVFYKLEMNFLIVNTRFSLTFNKYFSQCTCLRIPVLYYS